MAPAFRQARQQRVARSIALVFPVATPSKYERCLPYFKCMSTMGVSGTPSACRCRMRAVGIVHRALHYPFGLAEHGALLAPRPQALLGALRNKVAFQLSQHD